MMSNTHPEQDMHDQGMETLSALFDGELQGDAARFAIKRLGHDAHWRQACGTWQLLGDALRGQASLVAPSGFAARVATAVAAEPVPVVATTVSGASAASMPAATRMPVAGMPVASMSRRKWIGGAALAASVAMVAMLVARPFSQDAATTPGSAPPAPTELAVAPISTPAKVPAAVTPAGPDTTLPVSAAALAVAEVPRRAVERRSRGQSQRAALRAPKRPLAAPAIASAATAVAVNGPAPHSLVNQPPTNPFRPQHAEAVSRPWPRAVLPAVPATGAFTASYGSSSANSPSFYPFEPRVPHVADAVSAPLNADGPRP